MLNLNPLFYSTVEEDALLNKIELSTKQKQHLESAKIIIRSSLREGLPRILQAAHPEITKKIEPRFFTQGSWVYKTLNAPARHPQQADVDDGAYLPMSFLSSNHRPSVASKIFFASVEAVLAPVAKIHGWKLVTEKPTCTRVEVASDGHIDIPLYAIPDEKFLSLEKAALQYGHRSFADAMAQDQDVWSSLPADSVLLAHRDEDWIASDPRPIKEWFLQQVDAQGEQLRRVIRYLKAYRDWQWSSSGPASILLMSAAVDIFESRDRRDDLALADVVRLLPNRLRDGVNNPTDNKESLTVRLGNEGVEDAARKFEELHRYLSGALNSSSSSQACAWMVEKFGPRFPNRPDQVKAVSAAATVSTTPPVMVASPLVGRTKAG